MEKAKKFDEYFQNKNQEKSMFNNNDLNNNFAKKQILNSYYIIKNSFSQYCTDNSFIVIESINKILYLIYSTKNKSIISFDLNNIQKINEIKNAHKEYISNFHSILDKRNKRNLLMSLSPSDSNIKIWNINNFECLFNIKKIYNVGTIRASCFFMYNNNIYIATSLFKYNDPKPIKILNLNGDQLKEINDSIENVFIIDSYFDEKTSITFLITGNQGHLRSYNFNENKLYYRYGENDKQSHHSFIININGEMIQLIESNDFGYIKIWNFHSGELIKQVKVIEKWIHGIFLWSNELLFIGCFDKTIRLFNLKTEKIISEYSGHNNLVLTVKKIVHKKLGNILISQGWLEDTIRITKMEI